MQPTRAVHGLPPPISERSDSVDVPRKARTVLGVSAVDVVSTSSRSKQSTKQSTKPPHTRSRSRSRSRRHGKSRCGTHRIPSPLTLSSTHVSAVRRLTHALTHTQSDSTSTPAPVRRATNTDLLGNSDASDSSSDNSTSSLSFTHLDRRSAPPTPPAPAVAASTYSGSAEEPHPAKLPPSVLYVPCCA